MPAELVGADPAIVKLKRSLPHLGADGDPLVIVGETGVGKTLFAMHVHEQSAFRINPPATFNATTLEDRDQRIRLFGGEPRMLTTSRRSILENHTTAILKHVDYLRPYLQDELAQALTSQTIRRPGSDEDRAIVCRPIFTLRASPSALHKKGRLTKCLHQCLQSFCRLTIPPLRRRPGDIPLLAMHFMHELMEQRSRSDHRIRGIVRKCLDHTLVSMFRNRSWNGNVMELKVFIRTLVVLPYDELINAAEMKEITGMIAHVEEGKEFSLQTSMDRIEQAVVSRAIEACRGNIRRAGQLLGLTESAMHRRKATLLLITMCLSSDLLPGDLLEFSLLLL